MTEVTYKFEDLSDTAKDHARENYTNDNYLDYDWWDGVFEDAVHVAELLGITIDQRVYKTMSGKSRSEPNISFSGFSSQGDGVSFSGDYRYNPEAVEQVTAYCNDVELIRIAQGLILMQLTQRLLGFDFFPATISGSHWGQTVQATIVDDGIDDVGEPDEECFRQLMQDFADWIHNQLETTYDWLMSDECVDGYLRDGLEFDEDGVVI